MPDKARAIRPSILPEENSGKQINRKSRTRDIGKHFNLRGDSKADRLNKIAARGNAKQRRLSVFENKSQEPPLS